MPDGSPSWADPRHVLRRTLARASDLGFSFYCHPEIEFFLLKEQPESGKAPKPVDLGGYFDLTTHDVAHDFRRVAVDALEAMGISVEFSHHECAPGQQEIDLRYADALTTADNIMTFRHMVKEVALQQNVYATFMPKPFTDQPGSGMHMHLSLFEGDRNAFHDPSDELNLSKTGRSFMAGLLRHAREITAVTNQWVNSYKRLFGEPLDGLVSEAPAYVCWGHLNRSALLRVPMHKPGKAYLALSLLLSAGLAGIEGEYELPPGADEDVAALTDGERAAMEYEDLPHNLSDALRVMESSELVAATLGEHVFDYFLRNKRAEWADYRAKVTPYELDRYLPVL
jgi:glutamine synthetase